MGKTGPATVHMQAGEERENTAPESGSEVNLKMSVDGSDVVDLDHERY